jgi:perosamine synthetase
MSLIPHSRPTLPEGDGWREVTDLLAPGWAADGPCLAAFEAEAAAWFGCGHGVAVNSGTSALFLALRALEVGPGHEVLVPAYCCAALLNAVAQTGATPVLVDTEPGGPNLCPADAQRRRTSRTAAVVVAHMFGLPADVAAFEALGVPIVEDCAQSLGARTDAGLTGSRGRIAIGSFYATKVITTGQGGLAATSDAELAGRLRDLLHYDNRDEWRPTGNFGLGELAAALGRRQLARLPDFLKRRAAIADYYGEVLGSPSRPPGAIAYRFVAQAADAEAAIAALRAAGVDAKRPVYRPLHHYLGGLYPGAEAAHRRNVSLPIYPSLSDEHMRHVGRAAAEVLRNPSGG